MAVESTADHIHLRSPDPRGDGRLYVGNLGAREATRAGERGAARHPRTSAPSACSSSRASADTARPPEPPFLGIEHIGLGVNDLDAARRRR